MSFLTQNSLLMATLVLGAGVSAILFTGARRWERNQIETGFRPDAEDEVSAPEPAHHCIPVIACACWGQEGIQARLRELGVTSFLAKPYPSETLLTVLRQQLTASRKAAPAARHQTTAAVEIGPDHLANASS